MASAIAGDSETVSDIRDQSMGSEPDPTASACRKTVLPNGLRVLTEHIEHVDSVSLGLWIAGGAREDPAQVPGTTHFLEHMFFKGTEARSALQIAEDIDDIGGQVNGYTDREAVHLHARTVADQLEPALQLLFELVLRPLCAEEDVDRERGVVLQELAQLADAPEDLVHELVPQTAWPEHPLGRPLMGTPESVQHIDRSSLLAYLSELRRADRIIVAAAGRVEHDRVVELAAVNGGQLESGHAGPKVEAPRFHPGERLLAQNGAQVHFCLVTPGFARTDDSRYAFSLFDTILGGGTSSRLFQEIRENRGLTYGIGSYSQPYREAGLFVIDAGTAPDNLYIVLDLVEKELERLRAEVPAQQELERAKTQLRVALALAAESTSFRMQHLAVSEMFWGRHVSFEETAAGVEAVTAEDVHSLAKGAFTEDRRALIAIGPFRDEGRPK